MEVNNSNSSIREYQDNAAELFTTFSEAIQQLLQRKDLSSQDQTNFARDIVKSCVSAVERIPVFF